MSEIEDRRHRAVIGAQRVLGDHGPPKEEQVTKSKSHVTILLKTSKQYIRRSTRHLIYYPFDNYRPSRDLGLFRNPKRCDNIGDAETNHVNSRTDDLNPCHFCLSEAINETEYPVLESDRLFGAWDV
ncbi:unnamed protein product [Penicillium crustosum]